MATYFTPFVGRPIEPEQLARITTVFREVLDRTRLAPAEPDAAVLAGQAIRLFQIGVREQHALLRALLWFYDRTIASRRQQSALKNYTVRFRL